MPGEYPSTPDALSAHFATALRILWESLYQIPVLMGYGTFWALQPEESKALTESTQELMKTIPVKQRKKVMDAMNRFVPITMFASTVGVITYSRVVTMNELHKRGAYAGPRPVPSPTPSPDANPGSESGANQNEGSGTTPVRDNSFASLFVDTQRSPLP